MAAEHWGVLMCKSLKVREYSPCSPSLLGPRATSAMEGWEDIDKITWFSRGMQWDTVLSFNP